MSSNSIASVSVLTPVKNCQHYLQQTIDSILRQSHEDFEFLIADNGSSDKSVDIAIRASQKDSRIKVLRCPGYALPELRNRLVSESTSEIIAWIDADDIAEPSRLAAQFAFMQCNKQCAIVGSDVLVIDPDGMPIHYETRSHAHHETESMILERKNNGIFFSSCAIRRSLFNKVGGFRSQFPVAEDIDLYLRLAEVGQLANINQALTRYRWRLDNLSWTLAGTQNEKLLMVLNEARERRGLSLLAETTSDVQDGRPKAWTHTFWSSVALNASNFATAQKHASTAIFSDPLIAKAWQNWSLSAFPLCVDPNRSWIGKRWASSVRRVAFAIAGMCETLFPSHQPK